jgi:hypothetical protein
MAADNLSRSIPGMLAAIAAAHFAAGHGGQLIGHPACRGEGEGAAQISFLASKGLFPAPAS